MKLKQKLNLPLQFLEKDSKKLNKNTEKENDLLLQLQVNQEYELNQLNSTIQAYDQHILQIEDKNNEVVEHLSTTHISEIEAIKSHYIPIIENTRHNSNI